MGYKEINNQKNNEQTSKEDKTNSSVETFKTVIELFTDTSGDVKYDENSKDSLFEEIKKIKQVNKMKIGR